MEASWQPSAALHVEEEAMKVHTLLVQRKMIKRASTAGGLFYPHESINVL